MCLRDLVYYKGCTWDISITVIWGIEEATIGLVSNVFHCILTGRAGVWGVCGDVPKLDDWMKSLLIRVLWTRFISSKI